MCGWVVELRGRDFPVARPKRSYVGRLRFPRLSPCPVVSDEAVVKDKIINIPPAFLHKLSEIVRCSALRCLLNVFDNFIPPQFFLTCRTAGDSVGSELPSARTRSKTLCDVDLHFFKSLGK